MLRLKQRQRVALGETLRDLANLSAAALVFGQFVAQGLASWKTLVVGTTFWFVVVSLGLLMEGE